MPANMNFYYIEEWIKYDWSIIVKFIQTESKKDIIKGNTDPFQKTKQKQMTLQDGSLPSS